MLIRVKVRTISLQGVNKNLTNIITLPIIIWLVTKIYKRKHNILFISGISVKHLGQTCLVHIPVFSDNTKNTSAQTAEAVGNEPGESLIDGLNFRAAVRARSACCCGLAGRECRKFCFSRSWPRDGAAIQSQGKRGNREESMRINDGTIN